MTMDAMDKCLADKGFEVEREYHSYERLYSIRISKDGCSVTKLFKYPNDNTLVAKAQDEFLEKITHSYWTKYATHDRKVTEALGYIHHDVDITTKLRVAHNLYDYDTQLMMYEIMQRGTYIPKIKKVIFNDPATIVFWSDNTKTVVKLQDRDIWGMGKFDPEKGLAMAIVKKALGNKGNYYNSIRKWTDTYEAPINPWEEFVKRLLGEEAIRNEPVNKKTGDVSSS